MEVISIGFSYNKKSLLSKVIKAVEDSEYSHVYIRRKSKYGEYVYQASGLAVNFMNIDIFLSENTIVEEYEFNLPDGKRDDLIAFFIKYAGAHYETLALIKLLLIVGSERFGIKMDIKGDDNKFICSELGAFFCKEILEIKISENIDFITPTRLNPIIRQYGKRII